MMILSILVVSIGFLCLGVVVYQLVRDARRAHASLEQDAAVRTSLVDLADLAQSLMLDKHWRRALTDFAPLLERAVEESAARQERDAADIAHDVISIVPLALEHNLYDLDELGLHQLLGPCTVVWNLSDVPLDVVSVKQGGWYERTRAFLNAKAEIVFFQSSSEWVDVLRSMLQSDPALNPGVRLDPSRERCQLWQVPCSDNIDLLLPEVVIWDPGEQDMRALMNLGDPIEVEQSDSGFALAHHVRLRIRDAPPKLLSLKYSRALDLYKTFLEERRASGLPTPIGTQGLRKQPLDKSELRDAVSLDPERAESFIDEAASTIPFPGRRIG